MMNYAPIVVFAYNRADRLKELLDSLEKNSDTENMELFFFVDVPDKRKTKDIKLNREVCDFLEAYTQHCTKFKKIHLEIADTHKGLAKAVISGVSKVIKTYKKIIVLEDDLVVSHDFLDYMQRGLEFYRDDKKIWSVAAHCPMSFPVISNYKPDVFIAPRAESLGWGTWIDRWEHTDWEVKSFPKFKKDLVGRMIFNLGGNDLFRMLERQMQDESYNSWAIRWSYQQFRERKYTLYPKESRVIHCGNDNRSTHGSFFSVQTLKENYKKCVFETVRENYQIIWAFRKANNMPIKKIVRQKLERNK